ncbi:MAG: cell wall-binding repeat-containing protein, partial [Lachnospiraceae bacterium]|nr:cell wall-binding repeat-containing protein [Candidatus Equihabitans merdae]
SLKDVYYPGSATSWKSVEIEDGNDVLERWATIHTFADTDRLGGAARVQTSILAAEAMKEELGLDKFYDIILANAWDFPDALSGSYLAAKKQAPIILLDEANPEPSIDYIKNNLIYHGSIYILGGEAAISGEIEDILYEWALTNHSYRCFFRLAGPTRYETNLAILDAADVDRQTTLLIADGNNYADSLSASSTGLPILMVDETLSDAQIEWLEKHKFNDYVILGGYQAVVTEVEEETKTAVLGQDGMNQGHEPTATSEDMNTSGGPDDVNVRRIAGPTRYETSALIAKEFFPDSNQAMLAYAWNFPDALSGGPLAYTCGCPILLTGGGNTETAKAYLKSQSVKKVYCMGGNSLISDGELASIAGD